jgi:hypothetical protein
VCRSIQTGTRLIYSRRKKQGFKSGAGFGASAARSVSNSAMMSVRVGLMISWPSWSG